MVTSSDAGQQIVTEVVEAEQVIHDEALPWDVSNAWYSFCVALNLSFVRVPRNERVLVSNREDCMLAQAGNLVTYLGDACFESRQLFGCRD